VVELLIVVAVVLGMLLAAVTPWTSLLVVGAATTAVGLAFSVATGLWYHVALARALSAVKALTPRWWLRPVPLHARLDADALQRVLPWFYAGAAGFVVTVLGMTLIALGIASSVWRAP
jgi:hypothetical protein